ncbi:MAG TPA: universal stress protein [Pyrinomonadaceae bacterium]|jgi:nucleotide-binding universal stress UspA family protein|nr:universal stress protein [Pyrinomonadaceae bacterium]
MYPFRNILFPTDFSLHAHAALKYAAAFAREGRGRVLLLSVQDARIPANLLTMPEYVFQDENNNWLAQLRSQVKELLADPLLRGVEAESIFLEGDPANQVAQAAVDNGVDLITVATRDRSRLSRAFGGSIAEEIVAESPCAVLTIRPPQHDFVEHRGGQTQIRLNRVLLATNFRPSSAAATQLATGMANQLGAELHAVYVIGDYFEQISVMFPEGGLAALTRFRSHVQQRMAQLSRSSGSVAETHVVEGRPYQEIVKLAAQIEADLIVLGTAVHGSLFGSNQVLGSEIERVIRNAPCPVLCVPAAKVVTPLPAFVTQAVPQT